MAKLSDDEAHERLLKASLALGEEPGDSVRAHTALSAARKAMTMLILGFEQACEEDADAVPYVAKPPAS